METKPVFAYFTLGCFLGLAAAALLTLLAIGCGSTPSDDPHDVVCGDCPDLPDRPPVKVQPTCDTTTCPPDFGACSDYGDCVPFPPAPDATDTTPDAGVPDSGTENPDSGTPDAGTPDAGEPDAPPPPACDDTTCSPAYGYCAEDTCTPWPPLPPPETWACYVPDHDNLGCCVSTCQHECDLNLPSSLWTACENSCEIRCKELLDR